MAGEHVSMGENIVPCNDSLEAGPLYRFVRAAKDVFAALKKPGFFQSPGVYCPTYLLFFHSILSSDSVLIRCFVGDLVVFG